jgi:hypothetical protein
LYVAANTVHPQLQKIKFQFSGLDKENTIMLEEITLKEANLKFMEQRNRIMKEIISEKKMKLQKERDVLVWTIYIWPDHCVSKVRLWILNVTSKTQHRNGQLPFLINKYLEQSSVYSHIGMKFSRFYVA